MDELYTNPVGAPQIECCRADSFCTRSLCVQKSMHVESWVRFAGCRSCGLCVTVKLPNILFVGAFLVSGSQESPLRQVRRLSGSTTDSRQKCRILFRIQASCSEGLDAAKIEALKAFELLTSTFHMS